MTEQKRCQNLICEVLQHFFPKLNESMKLLRCERSGTSLGEKMFLLLALKCVTYLIFLEPSL